MSVILRHRTACSIASARLGAGERSARYVWSASLEVRRAAAAAGDVTNLTCEEGKRRRNTAAETMPSRLPRVMSSLERSDDIELGIPRAVKNVTSWLSIEIIEAAKHYKRRPVDGADAAMEGNASTSYRGRSAVPELGDKVLAVGDAMHAGERSRMSAELTDVFISLGREHGYDDVVAEFAPFKEFKSTWRRLGSSVRFQISDYMVGADHGALEDYAASLYERLSRRSRKSIYTPRLTSWLTSRDFLSRNQALYLERSRNLSLDHRGRVYDLQEAYLSLRDQGLVRACPDAVFNWTVRDNRRKVGYCSVLMKVVAISSIMDSEKVPPFVSEYVLYHELLHLQDGLRPGSRCHDRDFHERERLHPRWKESEEWLRRLARRRD